MRIVVKGRLAAALAAAGAVLAAASPAAAAGPPTVAASWATDIGAVSADLRAEINPNGAATAYRFQYISEAAYQDNLADGQDPFLGAARAPLAGEPSAGSGEAPVEVVQRVALFAVATAYRYRAVAKNSDGETAGPVRRLLTKPASVGPAVLPDGRAWERVSADVGAQLEAPGAIGGGGVFQASLDGNSLTYSSPASFGEAEGAGPGSQYLAARGPGGWSTLNLTAPMLSGGYPDSGQGVPYQLFSADLGLGLLSNGQRCRGEAGECPVANPPPPGSGAPAGYRNYYLRSTAGYEALVTRANSPALALAPEHFELRFAGASADLGQIALESCAALTAAALETPAGDGCDPAATNVYLWSGGGLRAVNLPPGESQTAPGASLAAQSGAISADGQRVYWLDGASGDLHLREGGATKLVRAAGGDPVEFQAATADGSLAFFLQAGHLYAYAALGETVTDLTPGGGVEGVLGVSADGARAYYLAGGELRMRHGMLTRTIAPAADASNYPPASGTARLSADGSRIAFLASVPIGDYDNGGMSQVYLYDAAADRLRCVSCNPYGSRPLGPSTIPGARANGTEPGVARLYKPRALSADGRRLFFDSGDALIPQDSNSLPDVYQWEEAGSGDCAAAAGCLSLISGGRQDGGSFVDADLDGSNAFFLTADALVADDDGGLDIYDARVGGGLPIPVPPVPCNGDECQGPAPAPDDPTPVTATLQGPVNPPVRWAKPKPKKKQKKQKRKNKKKKCEKAKGKRVPKGCKRGGKKKRGAKRRGAGKRGRR